MQSADPKHWDFYKRFRRRMQKFTASPGTLKHRFREFFLLGPDLLHLCIHLVVDKDVPAKHKAKLAAAIAYFISPLDILPELVLGPIGYLDDIAIVAYVLNSLLNEVPEEVLTRHWAGEKDVFTVIQAAVMTADRLVGKGLFKKIASGMGK